MKDKFEEFAGYFKPHEELEEELEEDGLNLVEVERQHFEENY